METKTRIETYSHLETLLEKLFGAPSDTFLDELKRASEAYFQPSNDNDPVEEEEVKRNLDAMTKQGKFSLLV